ncbi:hypothetical protein BUALT_Bualt16G0046200 [Buddleja alternifolia]|uniref:PHD finger protein ALFIN-LIKE n=1 Tax=Buddleja alternifolia TaxID=168488 RepID=A0AAV6W992_9LAMI|nr:hypothetical protein BUALT_Bualt16G0046200 [Buddleja alternifolia]
MSAGCDTAFAVITGDDTAAAVAMHETNTSSFPEEALLNLDVFVCVYGGAMAGEFPRTVEEIFGDFNGRRKALITALTTGTDFEEFFQQFNPVGGALCLYGFSNGLWEVNFPGKSEPVDLPEPISGINIARDEMQEKNLLALVAVHSDALLLSIAFYCGSMAGFDKADRYP